MRHAESFTRKLMSIIALRDGTDGNGVGHNWNSPVYQVPFGNQIFGLGDWGWSNKETEMLRTYVDFHIKWFSYLNCLRKSWKHPLHRSQYIVFVPCFYVSWFIVLLDLSSPKKYLRKTTVGDHCEHHAEDISYFCCQTWTRVMVFGISLVYCWTLPGFNRI